MKLARLLAAAPLAALLSMPFTAHGAQGPCAEPGGMPIAENGAITCTVQTSVTEASKGKSLASVTLGLVKEIRVRSVLRLDIAPDTIGTILGEHALRIPAQDVSIDVVFSDGRILPATLTLAPSITIVGDDACVLTATDAAINLTRFDSGLPDWIDATLVRYVNENASLKAQLIAGANAGFQKLQQDLCQ